MSGNRNEKIKSIDGYRPRLAWLAIKRPNENTKARIMKKSISITDVVDLLNEVCETDAEAMAALCNHRVPCSETLADHPTIQVSGVRHDNGSVTDHKVGLIGLINGLFGVDENGWGYFAANFDDDKLTGFSILDR